MTVPIRNTDEIDKVLERNRMKPEHTVNLLLDFLEQYANSQNEGTLPYDFSRVCHYLSFRINVLPVFQQNEIVDRISEILFNVTKILKHYPKKKRTVEIKPKNLASLANNLEALLAARSVGLNKNYRGNAQKFIKYLLTEEKSEIDLVKTVFNDFPHLITLKDENNLTFPEIIIEEQIKAIKDLANQKDFYFSGNLLYFDELLEYLLNHPKITRRNIDYSESLKKIKKELNAKAESFGTNSFKKKYIFWKNQLESRLLGTPVPLTMENLSYMTDVNIDFDVISKQEANIIFHNHNHNQEKVRRNGDYVISIDGAGTMERDDALSITEEEDCYKLGVHIANPLAYLDTNSYIFEDALNRTSSIYLEKDTRISMLPPELTTEIFSLTPGRLNQVISYYLYLDKLTGEIYSLSFAKEEIYLRQAFTYEEFNKIAHHNAKNQELEDLVTSLLDLRNVLMRQNKIDYFYEQYKNDALSVSDNKIITGDPAQDIVYHIMLTVNKTVATFFDQFEYPFIYRNHIISPEMNADLLKHSNHLAEHPKLCRVIDTLMHDYPKPFYDTDNKGHHGLKVEAYSHVTSPLRRLSDLVNLECINRFCINVPRDEDLLYMEELSKVAVDQIEKKEKPIEIFHKAYKRINGNNKKRDH